MKATLDGISVMAWKNQDRRCQKQLPWIKKRIGTGNTVDDRQSRCLLPPALTHGCSIFPSMRNIPLKAEISCANATAHIVREQHAIPRHVDGIADMPEKKGPPPSPHFAFVKNVRIGATVATVKKILRWMEK
jgi:hypothetical protein